jgi:hypothetical protein
MVLSFKRVAVASALVIPGLLGLAVAPAGATVPNGITVGTHMGPIVDLDAHANGTVYFSPKSLTVPVKKGKCSSTSYQFGVKNTTSSNQQMTLDGNDWFGPVEPGETVLACAGEGKLVIKVEGSTTAKLTIHST